MKLALRFLVLTLAGMLVVHAVFAAFSFRRELAVFNQDSWHDHEVLARALVPAFTGAWQHDGRREALRLLARVSAREGPVHVTWLPKGTPGEPSTPTPRTSDGWMRREEAGAGRGTYLVTYAPVHSNAVDGYLVFRESTAQRQSNVRRTLLQLGLKALGVFLWTAGISIFFGLWLIARPIYMLVRQARRIGSGELTAHSGLASNDEIGELAREMDRMAGQLERSQRQLECESAERLQALNQLRHADRLATVGKLASGVAHELGTPLNIVLGRAKMIQKDPSSSEAPRKNAEIITQQVQRMTQIVRQLLGFARAEESQKQIVDLKPLIEQTILMLVPMAQKSGIELQYEPVSDGPFQATANAAQIQQVLTNLVVNAIQASSNGDTVMITSCVENAAESPTMRSYPHLALRVADSGTGMTASVMSRVFEPFFTTKEVGEGTGLGLSVSHGIVQDHGGFMSVESEAGRGSSFTVYLPLATQVPSMDP